MPEIEAKFLLERREQLDDVLATLADLGHEVKPGPTQSIVDHYYDTEDWLVFRAGWAYRWRESNGQHKLTLKSLATGTGPVFVREEIEQPLTSAVAEGQQLPPGPVQARLEPIVNGHAGHELFRVRNQRTLYDVAARDESATMELAVDRTEIVPEPAMGHAVSFVELELELVDGDGHAVEEIAHELRERIGLVSAQLSKFERGLQAAGLERAAALGASAPKPSPQASMLDLVYAHFSRLIAALKRQQLRAWEGIDPEGVHQMRITIRRLRAALRMFRTLLPTDHVRRFNGELKWLAKALGAVRDADVYLDNLHTYSAKLPDADRLALEAYAAHLQHVQALGRNHLLEVLENPRYDRLIEDFERFAALGPSAGRRRRFAGLEVGYGAERYVGAAVAKIRKRGRRVTRDCVDRDLHELRIRAKRLRCLMEFFADLDRDKLRKPLKACKRLQDVLGEHQDAVVACERLRAYAKPLRADPAKRAELGALERLVRSQTRHGHEARARFPKAWRRFEKAVEDLRLSPAASD